MDAKMIRTAIAAICVATVSSVHGRSLIHYFDFDTPSGNGLAYTGVDKGTIPANFTLKGSSVPRTTGALRVAQLTAFMCGPPGERPIPRGLAASIFPAQGRGFLV